MKNLLLILICFLPVLAGAQSGIYLTRDSLDHDFKTWKYHGGDDPAMAALDYDDSNWTEANAYSLLAGKRKLDFPGIGWFRTDFVADTSLVRVPVSIDMWHYGASEVYLDGKRVAVFGRVRGRDTIEYAVPNSFPQVFLIPSPGRHVLAVRYANYQIAKNHSLDEDIAPGFRMTLNTANRAIRQHEGYLVALSLILTVLFALFYSFTFVHLVLYLYYRAEKSNLYYSLFTFSLGGIFLIAYIQQVSENVDFFLLNDTLYTILIVLGCFSLSGLINNLFSHNKTRFRIVTALCLIVLGLRMVNHSYSSIGMLVLSILVLVETLIVVLSAMIRRVKGSRIVGTGLLLFAAFLLGSVIAAALAGGNLSFNGGVSGSLFILACFGSILSIPVSMSIYLAKNFSQISRSLQVQLEQVQELSGKALVQEQEKKHLLETRKEELEKEVAERTAEIGKQHEELKKEKEKSDNLLLNILPEEVATELKEKGNAEAKHFDHVTVLFTDFVNFTGAGERMAAQELVDELHACFKAFDEIISGYNIEKIKTIGDAYLAVCGLPVPAPDHAVKVVMAAMEIRAFMEERSQRKGDKTFEVRIGIHSGPVVAGIVGVKKFAYDIWGDTVNTAARMEQHSEAGKINISQTTYELVKDQFECGYRGEIVAKNKGSMKMYFVENEKPALQARFKTNYNPDR